jgi:hypothetical protein
MLLIGTLCAFVEEAHSTTPPGSWCHGVSSSLRPI